MRVACCSCKPGLLTDASEALPTCSRYAEYTKTGTYSGLVRCISVMLLPRKHECQRCDG